MAIHFPECSCSLAPELCAFCRFLECLSLNDGAHLFAEDVVDAAIWHAEVMS